MDHFRPNFYQGGVWAGQTRAGPGRDHGGPRVRDLCTGGTSSLGIIAEPGQKSYSPLTTFEKMSKNSMTPPLSKVLT